MSESDEDRSVKQNSWSGWSHPIRQIIECLYSSNSDRLTLRTNEKGKNRLLWTQFKLAYIDGVEQPYVMCCDCKAFVKYSGKTGTGGLVRHVCFRRISNSLEYQDARGGRVGEDDSKNASKINVSKTSISEEISRSVVEELLMQNSDRLGFVPNLKGKSDVWSQFEIITVDNIPVNFASCKFCRGIVTYVSRTGTGSMTRHKCHLNSKTPLDQSLDANKAPKRIKREAADDCSNSSSGLEEYRFSQLYKPKTEQFRDVRESLSQSPQTMEIMTESLREQYARMLKNALHTFEYLQQGSFLDLAQTLVNLGADYGKIDVRPILKGIDLADIFQDS